MALPEKFPMETADTNIRNNNMQKVTLKLNEIQPMIKPLGRTRLTDRGQELSWSAAGISLCLSARRVALHFADYGAESKAFIGVFVNNSKQIHSISGMSPVVMLEDAQEIDILSILRLSEGDIPLYLTEIVLYGEDEPTLLPPPQNSRRRMLFIGDSITCGYGTDSVAEEDVFLTAEEDVTHAYAYLTAQHFGADYQIISISGMGIVKSCRGESERQFPDFFALANRSGSSDPDESGFDPHVVVINGGTNDSFHVPPEEFAAGVEMFLATLREKYPQSEIVWIYGAMGDKYSRVLYPLFQKKAQTDSHITFTLASGIYPTPSFVGVKGHPNCMGQKRLATELICHVENRMKGAW